jgi:hypothetical protein
MRLAFDLQKAEKHFISCSEAGKTPPKTLMTADSSGREKLSFHI